MRFTKKLRASDEIAVEMTGNTRFFHQAVATHVARVVAVDPNQFKVISQLNNSFHSPIAREL